MDSLATGTVVTPAGDHVPAGLVYSDLESPGIRRRVRGTGFSFHHENGRLVARDVAQWCRSLAIPPAWRQVWINRQRNGHILCTGLDAKGRRQYRYHPDWTVARNLVKFEHLADFAQRLHRIRDRVEIDLAGPRHGKRRMVAAAVRLIDRGLVRVGNEAYTRQNGSVGATTLTASHIALDGSAVTLDFPAKSGKRRELDIEDDALARTLRYAQELPGQRLFRWRSDDGTLRDILSDDVNAYLSQASGLDVTAKDFRTWGGTVAAWTYADAHRDDPPARPEHAAIKHAAAVLGNTVAVSRKFYVHPALVAAIEATDVPPRAKRSRKQLDIAETSVLRWLERR